MANKIRANSSKTAIYWSPAFLSGAVNIDYGIYNSFNGSPDELNQYEISYNQHRDLLIRAGLDPSFAQAVYYVDVVTSPGIETSGESDRDVAALAMTYYDEIDHQLNQLESVADQPEPPVEKGAIITAKEIIRQLRNTRFAPPQITWQGGDSIVMIWAFNSMTWAVTITEGDVGYVVRRDRKQIRIRDSIAIEDFKMLDVK